MNKSVRQTVLLRINLNRLASLYFNTTPYMSDTSWRLEKSQNVVESVCYMLQHTISITHDLKGDPDYNMKQHFHTILWDATKLFCDAARALGGKGVGATWSPELPKYLFDNPGKCEETLKLISDGDYEDTYYKDK